MGTNFLAGRVLDAGANWSSKMQISLWRSVETIQTVDQLSSWVSCPLAMQKHPRNAGIADLLVSSMETDRGGIRGRCPPLEKEMFLFFIKMILFFNKMFLLYKQNVQRIHLLFYYYIFVKVCVYVCMLLMESANFDRTEKIITVLGLAWPIDCTLERIWRWLQYSSRERCLKFFL